MAEQWIDAATVRNLVFEFPSDFKGVESLCDRAGAGLVLTRARLLLATDRQEERRTENVQLDPKLWTAVRKAPFKNDWSRSDFSAAVSPHGRWQAFGVTFGLSGVLEMLPPDRRTSTVRRLSVAGNSDWVPARVASSLVIRVPGIINARVSILEQARLGFVGGRAVLAQHFQHRHATEPKWEEREWDVLDWFWAACMRVDEAYHKWDLGTFSAEVPASAGSGSMTLSGIHFLAESLQVYWVSPRRPRSRPKRQKALLSQKWWQGRLGVLGRHAL